MVYAVTDPWYIKPAYPDYAPSGMPDFDEAQDQWGPMPGVYTWCGPVAVANSLWWLDSECESIMFPVPVAPPTISDHFGLVASYNPLQWDDHDPQNVPGLVGNLAFWMDTDGQRTGDGHMGTRLVDLEWGLNQYLMQQGVAPTFEVHDAIFPDFYWIENEIERCQDVVLFLEFWRFTGTWQKLYDNATLEAGHFVTCAGVNSSTVELLISDPLQDAFERGVAPRGGRSPVGHPPQHPTTLHNDAQFVSQDAYLSVFWDPLQVPPSPYGPVPIWELAGYLQTLGYDPSWHAFINAAVVTSPVGVHDVSVNDITPSKTYLGNACPHSPAGFCTEINVTVENQGDFTETFNVTLYADDEGTSEIGNETVTNLPSGAVQTLTFIWNSTGFVMGNYTLRAAAETVPGETDTADNTLTGGIVKIGVPCDITGPTPQIADGVCNMRDIGYIAGKFGTTPQSQNWDPNADVTGQTSGMPDDIVNMRDIGEACKHFNEKV